MRNTPDPKKYDTITIQEYRRRNAAGKIKDGSMKIGGNISYLNVSTIYPSKHSLYGKGK